MNADDFHVSKPKAGNTRAAGGPAPTQRYFDYRPAGKSNPRATAARVTRALEGARGHADQVHGIVLPELALDQAEFHAVERVALRERALLISGVRGLGPKDFALNMCAIQPLGLIDVSDAELRSRSRLWGSTARVQLKHHRWCLDRNQILQYELGGRLPASCDCWERTYIGERQVNFVTLGSWLTMCVLICEDLARQDPVAEVIRAVGPNIVFALLMDGPQLRNRWPSRYASVLAEDPGSSVLTLTSRGMAQRSRPREGAERPPAGDPVAIALWRDAVYGEREIAVDADHDACVLSLVCRSTPEYTIDGRTDAAPAHFPVFAGAHSFATG